LSESNAIPSISPRNKTGDVAESGLLLRAVMAADT
jgi:hypothetical protein